MSPSGKSPDNPRHMTTRQLMQTLQQRNIPVPDGANRLALEDLLASGGSTTNPACNR
jgi:hypothetical protein